jgi:hypothetical protein
MTDLMNGEPWFVATKYDPWVPKSLMPTYEALQTAPVPEHRLQDVPRRVRSWDVSRPVNYGYSEDYLSHAPVKLAGGGDLSLRRGTDEGRPLVLDPPKPPPVIPGLVGMLVEQAWQSAPFQVAEVAVASALSTMAVLCSRSYLHGTLGLSLYLLVLAQTSTGKSFGYAANDKLQSALANEFRNVELKKDVAETIDHMIIGEVGSAQGLAQQMPISPSTLFHADEYVDTIKEAARPNPPSNIAQIFAEIKRIVENANADRVYRGRKYSKRSSTIPDEVDVFMASLSILATGTPEGFRNALSDNLLTSGFMPRFTILEYEGGLTRRNEDVRRKIDPQLLDNLVLLYTRISETGPNREGNTKYGVKATLVDVQPHDHRADKKLEWFDNKCYRRIEDATENGLPVAGMWARAKEHVRQIASLIAIGCCDPRSSKEPAIELEHVEVAINIVSPSLERLSSKYERGDVGLEDSAREAAVREQIVKILSGGFEKISKISGAKEEIIDLGWIQLPILKQRCKNLAAFKDHKMGFANAFNNTIRNMAEMNEFKQVNYEKIENIKKITIKCLTDIVTR